MTKGEQGSGGDSAPGDSYAQWVRRIITRARSGGGRLVALFDSSVAEPAALLTETISAAFARPVTSRYVSAFSAGNPYVVDHLAARYGVDRAQVLCTTGATGALSLIYRGLVRPGEHVLVETPGFDLFTDLAHERGLVVDGFVREAPRFGIDVAAIAAALRPTTRMIVVSNLHNPSGMAIDHADLLALARLAEARGLWVLVDEVYGDYADTIARPGAAATLSPAMISVGSLTKIYGLSTLRCGWIVGSAQAIAPIRDISERLEFGVSNLAHATAALVLEDRGRFDRWSQHIVATARPVFVRWFDAMRAAGLIEGVVPPFGCIAFPRLVGIEDTIAFGDWLAARSGVIVAPGEYFGAPGYVRIGFAQDPGELADALSLLAEGLQTYRAATSSRAPERAAS